MKRIYLWLMLTLGFYLQAQIAQTQWYGRSQMADSTSLEAQAWLEIQASLPEPSSWSPSFSRKSPGGWHHHFQVEVYGKPLEGAEAVVFMDKNYVVRGAQWAEIQALPAPPAEYCAAALWLDGQWKWVRWEDHSGYGPRFWERWAVDAETGTILQQRDMLLHFTDSVGRALVFRPDPLAKAGVLYGGAYVDDNDQNTGVLDPLRDTVMVGLQISNGLFTLSNAAAVIQEFDAPVVSIPTQSQGDFFFSRADAGFEMTNALYHVEQIRMRLDSLGFSNLMTYAIPVDVNAFSGQDNSAFDRSTTPPRLLFGEGGVDDAEDSDVIAHEYGHALSHAAAPFTVNGTERECLEEALCDYFAMSHSYRWEPWRHTYVFNWDGHNPFWSGRMGQSTKDYSQLTFTSIYSNTDVFADPLGASMGTLGPNTMDRIVLEAMHNFTSFMTMPQAANWILLADTVLNGGQNASLLHLNFAARNILTPQIGIQESILNAVPTAFVLQANEPWVFAAEAGMLFNLHGQKVAEWTAEFPGAGITLPPGRYVGTWTNGISFQVLILAN